MGTLRIPPYFLALLLIAVSVAIELGAIWMLQPAMPTAAEISRFLAAEDLLGEVRVDAVLRHLSRPPPVLGLPALALVDILLVFLTLLEGVALMRPEAPPGRTRRTGMVICAGSVLVAAVALIWFALSYLSVMLPLYERPTLAAFLGQYGFFERYRATLVVGLLMALKAAAAGALLASHPSFATHRRLTQIAATSALSTLLVAVLLNLVPGHLAGVADMTATIITAGLVVIWAGVLEAEALSTLPVQPMGGSNASHASS